MELDPQHAAWTSDHQIVATVDFDFAEVDRRLAQSARAEEKKIRHDQLMAATADGLHAILDWMICGGGRFGVDRLKSIGRKALTLAWVLEHSSVGHLGLVDLARITGGTKQSFSKHAVQLTERFPIRCRGMKRPSARAVYAACQKANHWRRRPRKAQA
jgi:hypothetical protein